VSTIVDAANVIGARPDGWWRDRPGAAARLIDAVQRARPGEDVTVVLEGASRAGAEQGARDGVTVVHAPGSGDDEIVRLAEAAGGDVTVVTSDRGLADRVAVLGARVVGAGQFRRELEE
jgi:uncharacterized protein YaiI (UPF0178 family)